MEKEVGEVRKNIHFSSALLLDEGQDDGAELLVSSMSVNANVKGELIRRLKGK